jgi:hypothetical protein
MSSRDYLADSDLVVVYNSDDKIVGHMWYSTFKKIHEHSAAINCMYRLEYSSWNGPENREEYEARHELG